MEPADFKPPQPVNGMTRAVSETTTKELLTALDDAMFENEDPISGAVLPDYRAAIRSRVSRWDAAVKVIEAAEEMLRVNDVRTERVTAVEERDAFVNLDAALAAYRAGTEGK